jgi:hypothetical protein
MCGASDQTRYYNTIVPYILTQISKTQEEKKDPLATTTSGKKPENASCPEQTSRKIRERGHQK